MKKLSNKINSLNQPLIILIDEIHVLAQDVNKGHKHDERESALAALLNFLDEMRAKNICVIATTNYLDLLANPLKDRFEPVEFRKPLKNDRVLILKHRLRRASHEISEEAFDELAEKLDGVNWRTLGKIITTVITDEPAVKSTPDEMMRKTGPQATCSLLFMKVILKRSLL